MSKEANKKILSLVKPEYMKRIPFFVRGHATKGTCQLIEREHPELYAEFEKSSVSTETEDQMRTIINEIFEERMKKHNL